MLPRGTHHWAQLVKLEELERVAATCGLTPGERRGMAYLPAVHRAWWTRDLSVNYIANFGKPGAIALGKLKADAPGTD